MRKHGKGPGVVVELTFNPNYPYYGTSPRGVEFYSHVCKGQGGEFAARSSTSRARVFSPAMCLECEGEVSLGPSMRVHVGVGCASRARSE